ncbi:MAG TPA: type II toxin-antitoxin system RelE/ParE family toxin [Gemmatimonadaceae bacterium]
MANYSVVVKASAAKELDAIPRKELQRIVKKIGALITSPRPLGCEKLSGAEKYRLRQGDYRIVYEIDDSARRVIIVKIGHRRDVYR